MKGLYRFYWYCGRMGEVVGVFEATKEEILNLIGSEVYFGEILGKHSNIHGMVEDKDIELLTTNPDFIKQASDYGLIPYGYNPLDYL